MSDHVQAELRSPGIESSPAFIREPEGNGCAERCIRTLNEQLLWIESFATADKLHAALDAFRRRSNHGRLVDKHGFTTPAASRQAVTAGLKVAA